MSLYLRFLLLVCYSVFHLLLLSDGQVMAKSFQVTRAPNGTKLCAVDPPSTEFNVSELNGALVNIGTAPLKALCGWKCTKDLSCTSYNWRDDIQVCEVYYYEPTTCSVVICCAFYQMKNSSGYCKLRDPTTTSYKTTSSVATTTGTSNFTIRNTTEPTTTTSFGKTTSVATTARTSTFTIPTTAAVGGKFMIQQNFGNSTDFFRRSWAEYKIGFGNTSGDYWIGNDRLYQLTTVSCKCKCSADFYALNTVGIWYYRSYKEFYVADEATLYQLTTKGPWGNGSDALNHQLTRDFSTYDLDNDSDNELNCADLIGSGWWFGDDNNPVLGSSDKCGKTNLNANSTFFTFGGNPVETLQRSVAYITCV